VKTIGHLNESLEDGVDPIRVVLYPFSAKEVTDKSFVDKHIHVIWARGPQIEKMNLRPEDKMYKTMMLYQSYYKTGDDDAMYHLQDRLYRGSIHLNFFGKISIGI
jgi:hypothetical protein